LKINTPEERSEAILQAIRQLMGAKGNSRVGAD
jgi:hypothetical protein